MAVAPPIPFGRDDVAAMIEIDRKRIEDGPIPAAEAAALKLFIRSIANSSTGVAPAWVSGSLRGYAEESICRGFL